MILGEAVYTPPGARRSASDPGPGDRRRRILIVTVVGSVLLVVLGLLAAQFVKSPAQRASDAAPPAKSLITAQVESRRLVDTVMLRGKVTPAQSVQVPANGAGKSGADGGAAVVTGVRVKTGAAVNGGQVLLEISGRPVFVLQGDVPAYRDLKPGAQGKDVEQLQKALSAVGVSTGSDAAGSYGNGTRDGVAAFYQRIGYAAPQASAAGDGKDAAGPAGAMLPASEVVFLRTLPGRVTALDAQVGEAVAEHALTLSAGTLVVRGALAPADKELVRTGMAVKVLSELTGVEVAATVSSVADTPTDPAADKASGDGKAAVSGGRSFEVVVTPTKPLDPQLAGQDVRLTVEAAASAGPVLVVPVTAMSATADGRTVVTVVGPNGDRRRVEVRPGATAGGFVQVTPAGTAKLGPGERVVVGVGGDAAGADGKGAK